MVEYIEREATASAIRTMQQPRRPKTNAGLAFAVDIVNMMPAADVAPMQRWIPVAERLPDIWSDVLVAVLKHRPRSEPVRTMAVDFITMTGEWAEMSCDCRNEVTHWMPLPEPPKEEQTVYDSLKTGLEQAVNGEYRTEAVTKEETE